MQTFPCHLCWMDLLVGYFTRQRNVSFTCVIVLDFISRFNIGKKKKNPACFFIHGVF